MTVLRESAVPHLRAKAHLVGYVAHEDRGPVDILHHDVLNVVNRIHQSFAPDEAGHVVALYVGATRVDVILFQGFVHLAHAHAHGVEPLRVEGHLVLLDASAKRVDLHHARNHGQLALHYPVLNGAQLLRTVTGGVFGNKGVLVNLAQSRADGTHRGRSESLRNVLAHLFQLLLHQLARQVGAHVFFENDGDHRQAEA